MISATIGGITFSSDPNTSPYSIAEDGLDGWFSGAPVKTQPDDRASSDGVFEVDQFLFAGRPITLPGTFFGSGDDAQTFMQYRALAGLLASGVPQVLTVTDPAGPLSAEVMLYGSGSTLNPLVNGIADFVISFLAFDPVRYGPTTSQATALPTQGGGLEYNLYGTGGALYYGALGNLGRLTLTNNGNADVWPQFVVTGELTAGFFIQCLETGDTIRYDRIVPAGTEVDIDSQSGEVLIDGVSDGSTYITRDEWFPIPAHSSITVQFNAIAGSTGTPQMTALEADGYR